MRDSAVYLEILPSWEILLSPSTPQASENSAVERTLFRL